MRVGTSVSIQAVSRSSAAGLLLAAVLGAYFVASPAMAAPGRAMTVAAAAADDDLNRRGIEQRKAGDDRGARDTFQRAYDLTHSPRAAAQLGLVNQALGRWEMAEELVAEALRARNDEWIVKHKNALDEAMTTIEEHVGRLEVEGIPAGAEVVVNGRSVGKLPLPRAVAVSAGPLDLQLSAPGYRDSGRNLTINPQEYRHVFVRLDKAEETRTAVAGTSGNNARADATGSIPRTPTTNTTATDATAAVNASGTTAAPVQVEASGAPAAAAAWTPRRIVKWSSLGLSVAGLATGIVGSIIHEQRISDFGKADGGMCRQRGDLGVDAGTGLPLAACQAPLDSAKTARTLQIVGFAAGGVFAVGWLVLQFTEPQATGASTAGSGDVRPSSAWGCLPSLTNVGAACALVF